MSVSESNIKKKPKQTAIVLGEDLYERAHREAEARNLSMSAMGRMAYEQFLDEGKNEPIVMLQLVDLSEQIKMLKDVIPEKAFRDIQKNLSNIMKVKGGED